MILWFQPPPRPPVDPDDVNTLNSKNIKPIYFKLYMWVDIPLSYFAIEIWYSSSNRTTAFAAKRHYVSPKSLKCNISISNGPIAFKFYTEMKHLKLHQHKRPLGLIALPFNKINHWSICASMPQSDSFLWGCWSNSTLLRIKVWSFSHSK